MLKLDDFRIEITCSHCTFINIVFVKQIRIGDVIICRGCKNNIQLIDHQGSILKANRKLRRSINTLMKEVKTIGNITIKL